MEKKTKPADRTTRASSLRKPHSADTRTSGRMTRSRTTPVVSDEANGTRGDEFRTLFIDELKDIYWVEKHLVKSLSKLSKKTTSSELREAFENHREETEKQVQRLEQVFELIGETAKAKKCKGMIGLTDEADDIISETENNTYTRDAGLIIAIQKIEHYEIATYGSLATLARTMGMNEIVGLLEQTLDEEKKTDKLLTQIAESFVNEEATVE